MCERLKVVSDVGGGERLLSLRLNGIQQVNKSRRGEAGSFVM